MSPSDPSPAALAACFIVTGGAIASALGSKALVYLVVLGAFTLTLLVVAEWLQRRS
jgi:hypothetical protein